MCGIAGVFPAPSERDPIARMLDALAHRGPDGRAQSGPLGITRLAIVGADEPADVYADPAREILAVMNGEIYNHVELRAELGDEAPASRCDAALIPALYRRHGPAFIQRIRGPYAIAVYDARTPSLHLFRDVFGEKPLFYRQQPGAFVFASERKALATVAPMTPDLHACARYLIRGRLTEPESWLARVRAVLPGEHVQVTHFIERNGGPGALPMLADVEPAPGAVAARLEIATRAQLQEEVPQAVLLSGGLDSAIIARSVPSGTRAFTLVEDALQLSDARLQAAAAGLELVEVQPARPTPELWSQVLGHLEVPDAWSSWEMATDVFQLGAALRAHGIKVALSGEGADELFFGYPWDLAALRGDRDLALARSSLRSHGMAPTHLESALALRDGGLRAFAAEHTASLLDLDPVAVGHAGWATPAEQGQRDRRERHTRVPPHRQAQRDALTRDMQALPIRHADRLLMAHGVESRMPFLDRDVALLGLALPPPGAGVDKPALRADFPGYPQKRGFQRRARPADLSPYLPSQPRICHPDAIRALDPSHPLGVELLWRVCVLEETARVLEVSR